MNHTDYPNDPVITRELHIALSELSTPERPPLAAITSRGRAHQRRRLSGFAGFGLAGAAATAILALGLTGAFSAAPATSTNTIHTAAKARTGTGSGTIPTAAFTLTANINGTDTLTLTMSQMLNSATLQQALTEHGIPAVVKTGTYCTSNPAAPDPVIAGVLSGFQPPTGTPHSMVPAASGPAPSELKQMADRTVTVINPAALPPGTELFFGYSSSIRAVFTDLIYSNSYTCSGNP